MADASSPRDILAEVMADGRKSVVPYLAEMLKREKIAVVESPEERRLFWERAMTDEQEAQLWADEMTARGLAELTPEQATDIGLKIAQQVYPGRFDMLTGEGRDTQAKQARWAWEHARKGPPEVEQDEA